MDYRENRKKTEIVIERTISAKEIGMEQEER